MPRQTEGRVVELVAAVYAGEPALQAAPSWLLRPGRDECGARWPLVRSIYTALTGGDLPEVMPARERRSLDAIFDGPGGFRILEVDERQHFTQARAQTLRCYPENIDVAFDRAKWLAMSEVGRPPTSGGWARPCPPLFPGPGGRHLQRAFRDALADLLPGAHGWLPTLRIAEVEVRAWLDKPDAEERMAMLLASRLS